MIQGNSTKEPSPGPHLNERCCKNCIRGIPVGIRNEILCREKGIVLPNFCCSSYMSFEIESLQRHLGYRCSDCVYFSFSSNTNIEYFGVCSLFSVRYCDGSTRKTCSKFQKRDKCSA